MPEHPLGRIHVPDVRDAKYPMGLAGLPAVVPVARTWRGQLLRVDQGQVGACVGFTGANWMGHLPIYDRITNTTGMDLYDACKQIDGLPPGTEGTYDRALAQVLVAQGRIERYLWAQTIDELRTWVLTTGPVMVGTNWYESMFDPDGFARLSISGSVAGGHEWLVKGYAIRTLGGRRGRWYRMRNSWGPSWGDHGEAWIIEEDLRRLVFAEDGDALGAVEKKP